jgi:hypothetical protein
MKCTKLNLIKKFIGKLFWGLGSLINFIIGDEIKSISPTVEQKIFNLQN